MAIRKIPATLAFERVEIFLRVKGRLPNKKGDKLTEEILDEFCRKYEDHSFVERIVPLEYLYALIIEGEIKAKKNDTA